MDKKLNDAEPKSKTKSFLIKVSLIVAGLLIAFLVGFIPMWMQVNQVTAEHEKTKDVLLKEEIVNSLMSGVIDARRGEYESARKDASDFFTNLRAEIDKSDDESAYTPEQKTNLRNLFGNRDNTITLLAQRDQASVERLTETYLNYLKAIGEERPVTQKQAPPQTNTNQEANK